MYETFNRHKSYKYEGRLYYKLQERRETHKIKKPVHIVTIAHV